MCNCDCENQERCSIVGYFPIGFCCPKCVFNDAREICFEFEMKVDLDREEIPVRIEIINS